jgi:tetratricopeptide (TPR) repeat protein
MEYKKSLELEFYPWDVHRDLIDMYEKNKIFDKAIDEYKKAIEINPLNIWAYNGLGIVFAQVGRYEDAKKCFEKALEIEPTNRTIRKNKGEIDRLLKDLKKKRI